MQGRKTFEEKLFTNFQLSDRVPADNFYRKLKETLDLRFIRALTGKYYGTEGQESIDPEVFFKLMLVGYFENLASDRRIISTASLRLDILYFIGYSIDEPLPWHSTLSRTRQLYGEDVFKELFRNVLKSCIDKGMVSGRRQAIDSALIKANASMDSLAEKEVMEDADLFADELQGNEEASAKVKSSKKKELKNITDGNRKLTTECRAAGQMPSKNRRILNSRIALSSSATIPITPLPTKMHALPSSPVSPGSSTTWRKPVSIPSIM